MTLQALSTRLAAAAAVITLSACLGPDFGGLPPPPFASSGPTPETTSDSLICNAVIEVPPGELAAQLVGSWQDWSWDGHYKLFTFDANGGVSISAFPAHSTGATDATGAAPIIEARGQYTVSDHAISIRWDDGKTEVSRVQLQTEPGCVMLAVTPNAQAPARLEGDGSDKTYISHERVVCAVAPVEASPTAVHK